MAEAKNYLLIGRKDGEEQQVHAKGGHQKDVKKAYLEGGGYEVTITEVLEEPGTQKEQPEGRVNAFIGACFFIVLLCICVVILVGTVYMLGDIGKFVYSRFGPGSLILLTIGVFALFLFVYAAVFFAQENQKREAKKKGAQSR